MFFDIETNPFTREYTMKRSVKFLAACAAVAMLSGPALAESRSVQLAAHHGMKKDIVDTAAKAGMFKTLLAAAKAAGLVDALKGKGPLTVFAPTDAAFAKLPKGTVAMLLKPENKAKLQAVLKYHVVAGAVPSSAIVKAGQASAKTLQGQKVNATFMKASKKVFVNGAQVVKADIKASNGVIHVIDRVLMPK